MTPRREITNSGNSFNRHTEKMRYCLCSLLGGVCAAGVFITISALSVLLKLRKKTSEKNEEGEGRSFSPPDEESETLRHTHTRKEGYLTLTEKIALPEKTLRGGGGG